MSANEVTKPSAVKLGDRVIIDIVLMGETMPLEVIVAQIDGERIIGRPEGSVATAFARTSWRTA